MIEFGFQASNVGLVHFSKSIRDLRFDSAGFFGGETFLTSFGVFYRR